MLHRFLSWFGNKALSFIHIQLFVSIISLPILVSWGLPISGMAPVGNLLFGPFLTIFLGVSCIIFFTELLYIPNSIFIWCLEYITSCWQMLLGCGSKTWLLSFSKPSPWFFIGILSATIAIIYHKQLQDRRTSSICFSLLLMISYAYLVFLNTPNYAIAQIPCNNGEITIIKTPTSFSIIDTGILGRRISAPSWIEYSLLPTVRSTYGINSIDTIVLLAPGIVTFNAITELIKMVPIQHIYLPIWKGESPPGLNAAFAKLKESAHKHGTTLHRCGKESIVLNLDKKSSLVITPLDAQCVYRSVTYPAIKITGLLPDDSITLYSNKYTNLKRILV